MSNPSVISLQLAAAVANGISLSQTPGAAGNLLLNGSLVSAGIATLDSGGAARRVIVASNGNDTARKFTITGTNLSGSPISEVITGLNASTGQTLQDFKTVSQIAVDAATAGAITAGTNGVGSTPWVLDNFLVASWNLALAVHINSGAVTYTVEHTYDDPNAALPNNPSMEAGSYVPPLAWANPTLQGFAIDGEYQYDQWPIMAHRLTITAGTGKATMQSIQSGIA